MAQLLLDAARTLSETLDPDVVYDRFHDLLGDVVQHDGLVVSSYDPHDGLISCEYAWSDGNRLDIAAFPILPLNREGGGMQSQVIVSGEPRLFNDVAEVVQQPGGSFYDVDRAGNIRKLPNSGPPGTRAAMMVPVKHDRQVVGVVQVMSNHAVYSVEQLEIVDGLVGQMSAAVRNARLQAEQRRLEAAEAAARAAAAERELAATVLDAVGDGIFLVDRQGIIQLWNRAAGLMTGRAVDAVRGQPVTDAFPDWSTLVDHIPVAERGAPPRGATLPVGIGGVDLWLSFVAVRSPDGIVYAFRDLTNERRLDERTSDLIATISHELRTPMAAVYGAAKTLLSHGDKLTPHKKREMIEMVASQSLRLSQITEELLLATQLDRGALALEAEPIDVGEVVRTAVEALRLQLPPKVEISVEVAPKVGAASGASDRIEQVLMNLLDNAIKYGGGGPIIVRVKPGDGVVRIQVIDSGPGIPFAEQERIFERFYRSGPELTRATGGTGLGLYISRELVRRMGGRIDVRSQPGAGATFVVDLPQA